MKILVVSNQWYPDYVGGTARVVRATSVGLAERGHRVTVIAPRVAGQEHRVNVHGVELRRSIRRFGMPQTISDVFGAMLCVRRSDRRWDVVVAHDPGMVVGTRRALPTTPLVWVFHASPKLEAVDRRQRGLSKWERAKSLALEPVMGANERSAARIADRILVLSDYSRGLVDRTYDGAVAKVTKVSGGVDLTEFRPVKDRSVVRRALGFGDDIRVLLTVRRLVARTGVKMLLEAFHQLRPEGLEPHLIVVGDGEERHILEAYAEDLGIGGRVRFVGHVDDRELAAWYAAADLFVLPTVSYEGFGMATAEALASGTPVVSTPIGATPEVLAGYDPMLMAKDAYPNSLADTLQYALTLDDKLLRNDAARFAREHLGWRAQVPAWETALADCVINGHPSSEASAWGSAG